MSEHDPRLRDLYNAVPWTLAIGDRHPAYGEVRALHLGADGEKFYHFVDKHGVVSLMPASMFLGSK